jgi:hypothetical protein
MSVARMASEREELLTLMELNFLSAFFIIL